MFTGFLDDQDRQRVASERRAQAALETLCQRAPTRVVQWVAVLLERVCGRLETVERAA